MKVKLRHIETCKVFLKNYFPYLFSRRLLQDICHQNEEVKKEREKHGIGKIGDRTKERGKENPHDDYKKES